MAVIDYVSFKAILVWQVFSNSTMIKIALAICLLTLYCRTRGYVSTTVKSILSRSFF